jgi:predicted nucleic acid-binding protein
MQGVNPRVNQVAERPIPWRMWERDPPPRCFIDTNILIYADSDDEPAKQHAAALLIAYVINTNSGVISTQVLNEYANVALRKLKLTHERLRQQLRFYQQFEIVSGTPDITEAAVDLHQTRSVSFYDALILASAQIAGCKFVYSEDMNTGELIGGVKVVNPFPAPSQNSP